ncbi:MAG: TolC family protein [Bacteroidota bacterium]
MLKRIIIFSFWISLLIPTFGQDTLNLDRAIQIALENNYGILIAQNQASISKNNAHKGAAGLLPTISLSGGGTYQNTASKIEFASPEIPNIDASGAQSTVYNAGVNANYMLFNGGRNKNNYQVLQKNALLTETQTKATIEATITQVANAYYTVCRQALGYNTLQENLDISQKRLQRVLNQQEFGSANRLLALNAEVDINTDSTNLLTSFYNLENAKRSFNRLIGRPIEEEFVLDLGMNFEEMISLSALLDNAMASNVELRLAKYNEEISNLNHKIAKGAYAPSIAVNAGYNYNLTENDASFIVIQRNLGLTLGASLNFDIFAGNVRKVNEQNARISMENSRYQLEDTKLNLEKDLTNAFYTYQNNLSQLRLEEKSKEAAEENFRRTEDALKLGQANSLQFREAQLNLQRAKDRIDDLRYVSKLSEIELLRLSGKLVD